MNKFASILMSMCLLLGAAMCGSAQEAVRFRLLPGTVGAGALRNSIESNTSALITAINNAQAANSDKIDYAGIRITEYAKTNLNDLWEYKHAKMTGNSQNGKLFIENPCLKIPGGYQVSPLACIIYKTEGGAPEESALAFNFDGTGAISDVSITLSTEQLGTLMKAGLSDVKDEYAKSMIAYWMGQLKNAYEERDLSFFEDMLSDDAIIITGVRKPQRVSTDVSAKMTSDQYTYYKKTKEEYIDNLRDNVFKNFNSIKVVFEEEGQRVKQSVSKPRYYIVDVTQLWKAANTHTGRKYEDTGRLFVLWDMADPEKPTILARVWQAIDDKKRWDFIDFDNLE
ncbi:MAG: hypothetical protein NC102_10750 [Clostridium sp.]|nr:hypothetical protein [Clostridium sp.]